MNRFRWKFADTPAAMAVEVAAALNLSPLLARCLANRGCRSAQAASLYLQPRLAHLSDPFLLPEMVLAVDRLLLARERRERVVLFGDYDVDGVTSTALLTEFFQALGWDCAYYLPHRIEEGYGLSTEGVQKCLERFQTGLLLAVDCGSNAVEVIARLAARGIETIVLDHHQVSEPRPAAVALVNPQLGDDPGAKNFCSAALAFKLAHALLKQCRSAGWPGAEAYDLRPLLDLVALGTIADLVPITGENRILASTGLERLRRTERPGLVALKKVAGIQGTISSHEVAFQLAPRLNAAGRLETALDALELLLTRDSARAAALAAALDRQNRERQVLERAVAEDALLAVRARFNPQTDYAIVEGHAEWHLGVVGIVASRVLREFHRPVVILGGDGSELWRGSGRSIKGFDLAAGLRGCGDLLFKSGGHAMAAGVTLQPTQVEAFRCRLNELARRSLVPEQLQPELELDGEIPLRELDFPAIRSLARLQPIGQGNPPVQLVCRNLRCVGEVKAIGGTGLHRAFTVTDGHCALQAVWWNCGPDLRPPGRFDLAFSPELNEFNGTLSIRLKVLDWKEAI